MYLADMFLSTRNINVSELHLKTDCYDAFPSM
jgi:hypothetical protein